MLCGGSASFCFCWQLSGVFASSRMFGLPGAPNIGRKKKEEMHPVQTPFGIMSREVCVDFRNLVRNNGVRCSELSREKTCISPFVLEITWFVLGIAFAIMFNPTQSILRIFSQIFLKYMRWTTYCRTVSFDEQNEEKKRFSSCGKRLTIARFFGGLGLVGTQFSR